MKNNMIFNEYTFDNFVVGESNKFACDMVLAVAEETINPHYNPLYIYSKSGLGKTHLLHAVRQRVEEKYPDRKVIYVRSDDFAEEFALSKKEDKRDEFRNKYSSLDVLLIDDVQNLAGKPAVQHELLSIYNTLREKGAQIIIASDKSLTELHGVTDTLRTRFIGLPIEIHPPDTDALRGERKKGRCN